MNLSTHILTGIAALALSTGSTNAADVISQSSVPDKPSFDIQNASIERSGQNLVFRVNVADKAGADTPNAIGKMQGSTVYSYVWPTSFNPSAIGFSPKTGILAFAVTSHPDFDDTPLFDEDADGDPGNDGRKWHSHWVVLTKTDQCGPSGLKVRDIKKGETFDMPKTWPNLPIFIDSPGWHPKFTNTSVEVRVPFDKTVKLNGVSFDGVTSALRVTPTLTSPSCALARFMTSHPVTLVCLAKSSSLSNSKKMREPRCGSRTMSVSSMTNQSTTWFSRLQMEALETGYQFTIQLAHMTVKLTQPSGDIRQTLSGTYDWKAKAAIAASHIVAFISRRSLRNTIVGDRIND